MKDFRTLLVWRKAHELTLKIYKITRTFPKEELFGLTSQMRRSSSSIPTNIAEGCGRGSDKEFHRFLQIAFGSLGELDYQLILATDLGFIGTDPEAETRLILVEVRKMLATLIRKVQSTR
jgi:four helix bundle protein